MPGLLSSLHNVSSSLAAFNRALSVDQSNVANSATPGYAAARANILPIGGSGAASTDFVDIRSTGSSVADAIVQAATSESSGSETRATQLEPVNQLFDITGNSGILAALQHFSQAFAAVAVSPNDSATRQTALAAAGEVASAFNSTAANLDQQRARVDSNIAGTVNQINSLSEQIRQYNVGAAGRTQTDSASESVLRSSLDQLSSLVGITVNSNSDGTVTVLVGGEVPLVAGDRAYALSANPAAAPGSQLVSAYGGRAVHQSASGQLGAYLDVRNDILTPISGGTGAEGAPVTGTLNDLAKGFASQVNALVTSGVTPAGTPGIALFSFDQVNGNNVARTIAVAPGLTADKIATGTTGPNAQSNAIANSLAALPSSKDGAQDLYAGMASMVGRQLSLARNQSSADATSLTSAETDRQRKTGVSLDTEAITITSLQRAWQASARVLSILDELTGEEVNLIK